MTVLFIVFAALQSTFKALSGVFYVLTRLLEEYEWWAIVGDGDDYFVNSPFDGYPFWKRVVRYWKDEYH